MTVPTHSTAVETGPLARSLADAYRQLVEFHRDQLKTTFPEADAAARQATAHDLERLSAKDPGELSWFDLNRLADADPALAQQAWERIKAAAGDELASGHFEVSVLDGQRDPIAWARYLVLRQRFRHAWQPADAIEETLCDLLAQTYDRWLVWLGRLSFLDRHEAEHQQHDVRQRGRYRLPRHELHAPLVEAADLSERSHRLFLRTLGALRTGRTMAVPPQSRVSVGDAAPGGLLQALGSLEAIEASGVLDEGRQP